jgi:cysteine desulfurase
LHGWTVRTLPGDLEGVGLVAVAAVNHELGTLLDPSVIPAARAAGALVHVDAVQAAGKLALGELDADAIAISGHKLGAPQGIGAVALAVDVADAGHGSRQRTGKTDTDNGHGRRRRNTDTDTGTDTNNADVSVPDTGHQERGRRGGTENLLGIVGFGAVAATIDLAAWPAVAGLGDELERGILAIDGTRIHGADRPRIGGTINAGFAGARGESIVIALDLEGIAASTGAACTSGSVQPSPVLLGLGLTPEQAREAVRFSLGRPTTKSEIDRALATLPAVVERARKRR